MRGPRRSQVLGKFRTKSQSSITGCQTKASMPPKRNFDTTCLLCEAELWVDAYGHFLIRPLVAPVCILESQNLTEHLTYQVFVSTHKRQSVTLL
jgi:hypothetical protein